MNNRKQKVISGELVEIVDHCDNSIYLDIFTLNRIALRMAKTPQSFGCSECNTDKVLKKFMSAKFQNCPRLSYRENKEEKTYFLDTLSREATLPFTIYSPLSMRIKTYRNECAPQAQSPSSLSRC